MLNFLMNDLPKFIAYKVYNYITINHPDYVINHPRFSLSNLSSEFYEYNLALWVWVLLPLIVYGCFRIYERKSKNAIGVSWMEYIIHHKKYNNYKVPFFTKTSAIVFLVLFVWTSISPAATLINGFKNPDTTGGMSLEDLAYAPGNQPITDEIVGAMNDNVIPEVVKTGEVIEDVISDPALGVEMIEEVTGVNIEKIQQELE